MISNTKENNKRDTAKAVQALPAAKREYGNPDINAAGAYFLQRMALPAEDCPQDQSRRYWQLLLKEARRGVAGVKWLIDQAAADEWYRNNITSSKDLYYKRVKLLARARGHLPTIAVMPKGGGTNGTPTQETGLAHQPGA
jgi:hypothetical protein